jgi:Ser/Thr protein kinase RdoA (MazF antagonist)
MDYTDFEPCRVPLAAPFDKNTYVKCMTRHEAEIFELASTAGIAPKVIERRKIGENHYDLYTERYACTVAEMTSTKRRSSQLSTSLSHSVVELLKRLHALGIYHGDIHPDNVVVIGDTTKLIDFGASLYLSEITDRELTTNRYDTTIDNVTELLAAEIAECERI